MFQNLRKNRFLGVIFILCAIFLFCLFLACIARVWGVKTPLVIHFDAYKGIDYLGSGWDIFGLILAGFGLIGLNAFLTDILCQKERLLAYILTFSTIILSVLIFIGVSVILGNN